MMVGVESLVTPSLLDLPLSDAEAKDTVGAAVTCQVRVSVEVLPTASVAVTTRLCTP